MYHIEACRLLISVIPVLGELRWQWMHHAIMHLGAVALMAESSQIKKVALEDGLLVFVSYDDNAARQSVQEDVDSQSLSWTARAASAVCLNALLSYRKSSPMALLAHAAISSRKAIESHPIVSRNLSLSAPPFFRLSVLFKYTGRSLSENYIDSQNQLSAMRSYVKQVSTTRQYHSKSIMRSEGQLPSQPTVPLSTAPYHSNYKQHTLQEERAMMSSFMTLPSGLSTKPSSLTSSYTCFKADAPVLDLKSISQPLTGTANRRKLYSGKEVDEEEEEEDDDESEQPKSDAGQGVDIVVNGKVVFCFSSERLLITDVQ